MNVTIVGGGLAGCEAAWQLAKRGVTVRIKEMKPHAYSPAHTSSHLAELVCSNSLRSSALSSAAGLLKEELRILDSLIMRAADATAVRAGRALAVDRDLFARYVTECLEHHPSVTVERQEVFEVPPVEFGVVIVATGPLTSDSLANDIQRLLGESGLSFYDAIAPIVTAQSLDFSKLFRASRYGSGEEEGDYLNAPLDERQYRTFVSELLAARKVDPHPFEHVPHFEGCLPVEVLASRGPDTLAFGPMKPVGLVDPSTGKRPFAVVQLRAENQEGTLYNLVGFQTKMTYGEQERVFRTIPGLERAEFVRLGSVHRNTYLDAPSILDPFCRAKSLPHLFFAGQITGVEGYIESTASGLVVAILAGLLLKGVTPELPPPVTATGALMRHTQNATAKKYQPMNVNFGIMDPLPPGTPKRRRKELLAERALMATREWVSRTERLWEEASSRSSR